MTTIDEFRDAVTNHFAWSRRLVWTVIATAFLLFAGAWLATPILVPDSLGQAYVFPGLFIGLGAVVFVAVLLGGLQNEGRFGIDPRLACPRCTRPLQLYSKLVIETGDCPRCGCRVLADCMAPAVVQKRDRDPQSIIPRPIGRSESGARTLRKSLRRVVVAVLYVAVTLLLILGAITITRKQDFQRAMSLLALIPLALLGLSALILAPGPRRDRTHMLLVAMQLVFGDIFLVGLALNIGRMGGPVVGALLALFVVLSSRGQVRWTSFMISQECPECGRKSLVHAAMQLPGIQTYHDYFWCLNCYERYKRLENGPWETAWSPHDDRFYWLWSLRPWLRAQLERIVRKLRTAD